MNGGIRVPALAVISAVAAFVGGADTASAGGRDLRFRPVLAELPPQGETDQPADPGAATAVASCDVAALEGLTVVPSTPASQDDADACVVLGQHDAAGNDPRLFLGPAALSGDDVRKARTSSVEDQGYLVELKLKRSGKEKLNALAARLFPNGPPQNQVAIVLDSEVLSAPAFQGNEFGGVVVITGGFTKTEAREIAKGINSS